MTHAIQETDTSWQPAP